MPNAQRQLSFRHACATGIVLMTVSLAILDSTIATTALPVIARGLQADDALSVWITGAYQLAMLALMLPFASLAERFGYRQVFLTGLCIFTASSALCAVSTSMPMLIAARGIQGLGMAATMSVCSAFIQLLLPEERLGRVIAWRSVAGAVAGASGPSLAAVMLRMGSWHWLFAFNIPLGIVAIVAGYWALPESTRSSTRFDSLGALLNVLGLGLLAVSLNHLGAGAREYSALIQTAVALMIGYIHLRRRQVRQSAPLLSLHLLNNRLFSKAICLTVKTSVAEMLMIVSLPFLMHGMLDLSQYQIGLVMGTLSLTTVVLAPVTGILSDRYRNSALVSLGLLMLAFGLLLLAVPGPAPGPFGITWRVMVCGIGLTLFRTPNARTLLTSAPTGRGAQASSIGAVASISGQTCGTTMAGMIFRHASHTGPVMALYVAAFVALIAAGLSILGGEGTQRTGEGLGSV